MAAKKAKKPGDVLSDVFHHAIEIMSDVTTAAAAASVNASLISVRHLVKFQKGSVMAVLKLLGKVQEYTEKSFRDAMKNGSWLPAEGKDVVDEWAKMMDSGIDEFSRVVDKSFDLMLKYLDRVEKEAKAKDTKEKAPAKKSAAKKPAKRKPGTKKKSAASASK